WYTYQEELRGPMAQLVGALPREVVFMNGLTVNLHLLFESFYRPTSRRHCILMDEPIFPSDHYAVQSQLRRRRFEPRETLLTVKPRPGESLIRQEDAEAMLWARGEEIALVLWSGVNFFTGQFFDLAHLTRAAHAQGCVVGLDLAHAAGNVP